jgi:hypothetical protein
MIAKRIKDTWKCMTFWNRKEWFGSGTTITATYRDIHNRRCGYSEIEIRLTIDPRTDRPWKSVKAAKEWFKEMEQNA